MHLDRLPIKQMEKNSRLTIIKSNEFKKSLLVALSLLFPSMTSRFDMPLCVKKEGVDIVTPALTWTMVKGDRDRFVHKTAASVIAPSVHRVMNDALLVEKPVVQLGKTTQEVVPQKKNIKKIINGEIPRRFSIKTCREILRHIEVQYGIPKNLLSAIATIESRSRPWAVWAKGRSYYFKNSESARRFIETHVLQGTKTLFIGCMQICMKTHGRQFKSLESLLDPYQNIRYAAKLLRRLYRQYGSWEAAVMYYNASHQMEAYRDKVIQLWKRQSI